MKKLFAIILVLALALVSVGFAEEEKLPPMPEEAVVYEGTWVCDRASIEIIWEEEGFRVFISWGSSASETSEWEYSCYYDAETKSLEAMPTGIHTDNVYGEDGEIVSSTVIYDDGEATFTAHCYPTAEEFNYTTNGDVQVKIWKMKASVKDDFVV